MCISEIYRNVINHAVLQNIEIFVVFVTRSVRWPEFLHIRDVARIFKGGSPSLHLASMSTHRACVLNHVPPSSAKEAKNYVNTACVCVVCVRGAPPHTHTCKSSPSVCVPASHLALPPKSKLWISGASFLRSVDTLHRNFMSPNQPCDKH